ncbi:MAG: hypothetical protein IKM96_04710 [Clostridiales bacterium]|nr:hypothetical protein [Clostridiales bacterium]
MTTENSKISKIFCSLSTVFMVVSCLVSPVGMFMWFGAATEYPQDVPLMDKAVIFVIAGGIAIFSGLILGIIAKIKNRQSKWAVVCIILTSIFLFIGVIAAFFFIWAASQYHYQ